MTGCSICHNATRVQQWTLFCPQGVEWAAKFALAFDVVLEAKARAGPDHDGHVYACPEIAAHGEAYALTAELLVVQGIQEMLF